MDMDEVGVLAQNGDRLCNCSTERAEFLVKRAHAEIVSHGPLTIRLTRVTGNGSLPSAPSTRTESQKKRASRLRSLRSRDGTECFYCGLDVDDEEVTLEHLLAIKDGGTSNLANLVLAHRQCNELAADLPVIGKVKLRESMRCGLVKLRE